MTPLWGLSYFYKIRFRTPDLSKLVLELVINAAKKASAVVA
jgi:hypothetical protein